MANAIEDAEKLDVIEVYTEMRRTLFAKTGDVTTLLPDSPSVLGHLGMENFTKRAESAISNLKALPETDSVRMAFLPSLERELGELVAADKAEDQTRDALKTTRMALTLYKSELAQARDGGARWELLFALGFLVFAAWYGSCRLGSDDESVADNAYPTFTYARNLAEGHGLRFNAADPAPTPGSSSVMLVLFNAA
ncbi:MAG TPA: hypothetical protein PK156_17945, partial [Polyangium sp.]|nr:hypothetical protein [Polyangium sp.]